MEELEIEVIEENELVPHTSLKKKTSPYMTKFEYSKLKGFRIIQLMHGKPPKVNLESYVDYEIIAEREIHEKVIPLRIKRRLPGGEIEIWNISEMNIRDW